MNTKRATDVVIIGGGVIGCSIAYHLSKAGVQVRIVEREEVAAEASSAAAGLLAPAGVLTGPKAGADLFLASWSITADLMSPDSYPILGKAPGWENVILATGHGAGGFELSAITGKTIAELLTTGHISALIQPFGIERFMESGTRMDNSHSEKSI